MMGSAFSGWWRWTCTRDSDFLTFFRLGLSHIADPKAYDHILFITALTVAYPARAWRQLLVLITAFTLGHSLTLALATLEAGQLVIVAAVLSLGALADRVLRVERRDWVLVLSGATAGVAVMMAVERL